MMPNRVALPSCIRALPLRSVMLLITAWMVCQLITHTHAGVPQPSMELYMNLSGIPRGRSAQLAVLVRLPPGIHVNSHKPRDEWLIPTTVEFDAPEWLQVKEVSYPPGKLLKTEFGELSTYEGEFIILATLNASPEAPLGHHQLTASLHYQACDERRCYQPTSISKSIDFEVVEATTAVTESNREIFARAATQLGKAPLAKARSPTARRAQRRPEASQLTPLRTNPVAQLINRWGWLITLLVIFAGGLALNMTPCVFPLIPITVGYFAQTAGGHTSRLLMRAVAYVLGIALTYSAIGVIAALTGGLFGAALQHPVVLTLVATIIAILAMGMFGIYTLELPSSVLGKLHQVAGVAGPFGLGAIAGLVAAPCVGPFVVALLTFVAASGNALIGFLCFFALSLGLGIPYLFLAIFSGSLQRLPKAGTWMEWVRKVFGFLLLGLAAYFISPLLPSRIALFIIPALAIVAGIYLGWFEKSGAESIRFQRFKSLVGLAVIALSMVSIIQRSYSLSSERIWLPFSEQRLQQAIADGKPVVIDFTAKWCAMCKKLEKRTFANPRVRAELRRFVCLKVDMTYGSLTNQNVAERYDVRGLPTVVLVDSKGREHRELRITGFISPQEFIQRLKQLR